MSSSHLTNGKIVEFAPNGQQTESSEPNEQFIAVCLCTNQGTKNSIMTLNWNCKILTSDLVCITIASNFRDDHILDKITIMYTYAAIQLLFKLLGHLKSNWMAATQECLEQH